MSEFAADIRARHGMSRRACFLDIVRGDDGWFWRFLAANGRQLARSSETYSRRDGAVRSAQLVLGVPTSGHGFSNVYPPYFEVRERDERGGSDA